MFNKILKALVHAMVFLLPVFWLPFSFEWIEFSKIYLLFFLGLLATLVWLLKMIIQDREIRVRFGLLDLAVFIFAVIGALSLAFSVDLPSSIFGTYGRFSNGFIAFLSLFLFYLLIRNNVDLEFGVQNGSKDNVKNSEIEDKPQETKIEGGIKLVIKKAMQKEGSFLGFKASDRPRESPTSDIGSRGIFASLFWGAFLATLWSFIWLMGVGQGKILFSLTSVSANGFSVFLALMVILVLGKIILGHSIHQKSKTKKGWFKSIGKIEKAFCLIFLLLAIFLLFVFDYGTAWTIMGIGLISFIVFAIKHGLVKENLHRMMIPIFFVMVAALFLIINTQSLLSGLGQNSPLFNFPAEPVLWQGESWRIGFLSAKDGIKNLFLGSGMGTFLSDYSMFKSAKMNEGLLWQLRFDRAGSNAAEILATMGFLGFLAFLFVIFAILRGIKKSQAKTSNQAIWWGLLAGAIVSQFIFYQNMVLGGLFWLALAVCANLSFPQARIFSFKEKPAVGLLFEVAAISLFIALAIGYFFGIKFYLADRHYIKGVMDGDLAKKIELFERAVILNRHQPHYQIAASQALILKFYQELGAEDAAQKEKQDILANYLRYLNSYARNAILISPNQIVMRQNLANIYRDLVGVAGGAADWALTSYNDAIEIEPKNPILYAERGKIYLSLEKTEEARNDFEKSISLAPSYTDGNIQYALFLENQKQVGDAIKVLEEVIGKYPFAANLDTIFNLGRLYHNNNQHDQAIDILESARTNAPNNSNILFVLSMSYQKKGNISEAKKLMEKVLELNPQSEEAKRKLEELKGGRQPNNPQ